MKGISAGPEFLGKLLIIVFIIGVIVILLVTLLPSSFGLLCEQRQHENVNSLVSDALATRASEVVKTFSVEDCVESIDFNCEPEDGMSCYKIKFKGEGESTIPLSVDANILEISGDTSMGPGKYTVTISPYAINFPQSQ